MKKAKRIAAIFLTALIIVSSLPVSIFAASGNSYDFNDISVLDQEYSYGQLVSTESTTILKTENCTAGLSDTKKQGQNQISVFGCRKDETAEIRITDCSVDADGDLCDAVCTVSNLKPFKNLPATNYLAPDFGLTFPEHNEENHIYAELVVGTDYSDIGNNLIYFWLKTSAATVDFSMTYYKAGTDTPANISHNTSMFGDIDVPLNDTLGAYTEEEEKGNEFVKLLNNNGNFYYNSKYYLEKTNSGTGIYAPLVHSDTGITQKQADDERVHAFGNSNRFDNISGAVMTQELIDGSYSFHYGGYGCGLLYAFVSPYTYKLDSPVKEVSKETVKTNEEFVYTISQYVPNNYTSTYLNFIENAGGLYTYFIISDTLEDFLVPNGTVTVTNESDEDVSHFFDIHLNNQTITAKVKKEFLNSTDFYTHTYKINIPVCTEKNCSIPSGVISNTALTTAEDNNGSYKLKSNTVRTKVTFDVTTEIENGIITPDEKNISANTDRTITFTPYEDYYVSSVIIDGKKTDASGFKDGGSYTFSRITSDHHISVICTPYAYFNININYVDENGNSIAEDFNQSLRAEKAYDVTDAANRNIENYTLKQIDGDVQGVIRDDIRITVHYTRNRGSILVNHMDTNSSKLAESEIYEGYVSDEYTSAAKEIYGYTLTAVPDNASGIFTDTITAVNYIYDLKNAVVEVKYMDTKGNSIAESDTIHGKVFDKYMTSAKNINGYSLKTTPENTSGTMTEEKIAVTYVYEKENKPIIVTADADNHIIKSFTSPKTGADFIDTVILISTLFLIGSVIAAIHITKKERRKQHESDQ